jgi:hypothetical protein
MQITTVCQFKIEYSRQIPSAAEEPALPEPRHLSILTVLGRSTSDYKKTSLKNDIVVRHRGDQCRGDG